MTPRECKLLYKIFKAKWGAYFNISNVYFGSAEIVWSDNSIWNFGTESYDEIRKVILEL